MSQETEPHINQKPKDERDELALLEAKVAKKRIEVQGATNFGKFDITAPNNNEETYGSYEAQRPSDGIVRDFEGFRHTGTGQFATEAAYTEQTAPKNEILDMLYNPGEHEEIHYDTMSRMELIKAAADAKVLGDRAELEDIRAAFEHNLMEEFTREISAGLTEEKAEEESLRYEGTKRTDEQFNAELAQFDAEIDKLLVVRSQKNRAKNAELDNESVQDDSEQTSLSPELNDDLVAFGVGDVVKVRSTSGDIEEGWEVSNYYTDAFGKRTYDVSKDGVIESSIIEEQLIEWQNSENVVAGEDGSEGEALEGESQEEYELRKAMEAATQGESGGGDTPPKPAEGDEVTKPDETGTEQSRTEKMKSWWKNNKEGALDRFRPSYWAARWETSRALKRDARENMTAQELDEYKKYKRVQHILGGAALFVGGIIAGELIMKGIMDTSTAHSLSGGGINLPPTKGASGVNIGDVLPPSGGTEAAAILPDPNFNISSDQPGGIQLLERLGVSSPDASWVRIQDGLLKTFPTEFYQPPGAMVRIDHTGPLSIEAQQYIKQQLGL